MKSIARQIPYARAVSEIGNSLRYIALPLGIIAVRNDAQDLAYAEILETLGFFCSGLIAPLFIDRLPRLRALVWSDAASLMVTAFMVYAIFQGSLPLLWSAAFAMTFVDTFYSSSLSAVVADLNSSGSQIRPNELLYGFSRLQFYTLVGGLIGSLAGTQIVTRVPLWSMLALDGATFLISSYWIYRLATVSGSFVVKKVEQTAGASSSIVAHLKLALSEWKEGFIAATQNREALRHILAQGVVGIAHGLLAASTIGHYKVTLGISNDKVALAQTNNRVWQFLGALFALHTKRSPRTLIVLGTVLMMLGYAGMSFLPFYGFLLAYGMQQLGNAVLTPTNRTLSLMGATPETRGRVSAFRGLMIDAGILTGNIAATWVIAIAGTRWSFGVAALLLLITLPMYRTSSSQT